MLAITTPIDKGAGPFFLGLKQDRLSLLGGRSRFQQIGGLDLQDPRQRFDHIDCRRILASFQGTDVGSVDVRPVSELFLRKTSSQANFPQIGRESFSDTHERIHAFCSAFIYRVYSSFVFTKCLIPRNERGTIGPHRFELRLPLRANGGLPLSTKVDV